MIAAKLNICISDKLAVGVCLNDTPVRFRGAAPLHRNALGETVKTVGAAM
jgi:hypothetical protein